VQSAASKEDGEAKKKGRKKPAYSGGLVLEPKRGAQLFTSLSLLNNVK
jgi:hypothetical protein